MNLGKAENAQSMPYDKFINTLIVVEKLKKKMHAAKVRLCRGIHQEPAKVPYITLNNTMALNWINSHYNQVRSKQLTKWIKYQGMEKSIRSATAIRAGIQAKTSTKVLIEQIERNSRSQAQELMIALLIQPRNFNQKIFTMFKS